MFIEELFANTWNRLANSLSPGLKAGLDLGFIIAEGRSTKKHYFIPYQKLCQHLALLGKTGMGKSHLIRLIALQAIRKDLGLLLIDTQNDLAPFFLSAVRDQEVRSGRDLSAKTIVIDLADPAYSVGLNVLETGGEMSQAAKISELVKIFEVRWDISLGPPTAELFRNALHVLSDNRLTLVELRPLLCDSEYRARLLKAVSNPEVRDYFTERYDQFSEAMQATRRDPVLNKISEFITDIHFRHVIGQEASTFALAEAMDQGCRIIVRADKGRLGPPALLFASLLLAQMKSAIFRRSDRKPFLLILDEIQNLVTSANSLEMFLAEARKTGVAVVSAHQFLEQIPNVMRAALMAVNSHVYFRLSPDDAQYVSASIGGGKNLAERLRNLPERNCIVKQGEYGQLQISTHTVPKITNDYSDLLNRSNDRWARKRADVESEIQSRKPQSRKATEVLDEWE